MRYSQTTLSQLKNKPLLKKIGLTVQQLRKFKDYDTGKLIDPTQIFHYKVTMRIALRTLGD